MCTVAAGGANSADHGRGAFAAFRNAGNIHFPLLAAQGIAVGQGHACSHEVYVYFDSGIVISFRLLQNRL